MTVPHHHYDPNQPRVPAGDPSHHGGRWTDDGISFGGNASVFRSRPVRLAQAQMQPSPASIGQEVVLPNGMRVPDAKSPTGYLLSPVADLRPVAEAGWRTGMAYRQLVLNPNAEIAAVATLHLALNLFLDVGTGGRFDYQRSGNQILGLVFPGLAFTQLPDFRNVSNFNVGLYCQQAGLTLDETLRAAGVYAAVKSSNYRSNAPYGLDSKTREFIEIGYQHGQSSAFNSP